MLSPPKVLCLSNRIDKGITLLEVLLSLIIIGLIVDLVLNLYLDQYRLLSEVKQKAELRFVVFRAGQVLTSAVTKAEKVTWVNGDTLLVEYQGEYQLTDSYYLDDKDRDGNMDLYRHHLGVSNPVVTGVTEINVLEVRKGLWEIHLQASHGSLKCDWYKKVRQRNDHD
ncbi:MAG: hypothetical protein APF84_10290 [Gracilibacter sp. BRH_c7a]|nr:MAG: hypothetical protein APF84_10290 [Gracilibacter sp. BRH_c7a]